MISEIEAKPLDLRVKCEPDETNSESDDAEDIKPIYKGYKKCIIKQFRKSSTIYLHTNRSHCLVQYIIVDIYYLRSREIIPESDVYIRTSRVKSLYFTCYPSI